MHYQSLLLALAAFSFTTASPPTKAGYNLIWSDDFNGAAGSAPSSANWYHKTPWPNANPGEVQHYTTSTANARLSGDGHLQIIPLRSSSGEWTSARLHGAQDFTCALGKTMLVEAEIYFGDNPASEQQGIWPAFWALGSSFRAAKNPVVWPACGEWDISEGKNGVATNFGTLHCDKAPGGHCNEYAGLGSSIGYTKGSWNTWAFKVDRTDINAADWQKQSLTWYLNGKVYKTVTGADVGDLTAWKAVARSPFFLVLNVAVGGAFPGAPTSSTQGGLQSGMSVAYVAVYGST